MKPVTERALDVQGAAEHNLRDVDVTFGPGLTAVVGVSGSGTSALAFDVVYAETRTGDPLQGLLDTTVQRAVTVPLTVR